MSENANQYEHFEKELQKVGVGFLLESTVPLSSLKIGWLTRCIIHINIKQEEHKARLFRIECHSSGRCQSSKALIALRGCKQFSTCAVTSWFQLVPACHNACGCIASRSQTPISSWCKRFAKIDGYFLRRRLANLRGCYSTVLCIIYFPGLATPRTAGTCTR